MPLFIYITILRFIFCFALCWRHAFGRETRRKNVKMSVLHILFCFCFSFIAAFFLRSDEIFCSAVNSHFTILVQLLRRGEKNNRRTFLKLNDILQANIGNVYKLKFLRRFRLAFIKCVTYRWKMHLQSLFNRIRSVEIIWFGWLNWFVSSPKRRDINY